MPKGALLHCHMDATVDAHSLLKIAIAHPAICVRVDTALTPTTIRTTVPTFQALPSHQLAALSLSSLTDESYVAGSWVPLKQARENFSVALGGPQGFDDWVASVLSINPADSYVTHTSVDRVSPSRLDHSMDYI